MIAVLPEKFTWYLARSSGVVAWLLAAAAIVWGLALSSRLLRHRARPAWLLALHRYLAVLTLVFTGVHVGAIAADNWVHFGWADTFIPFASSWRPWAVAWGIIALWLLLAVQVTSWWMPHIPRRAWHTIHLSSLVAFLSATVHAFTAGADAGSRWMQWGAGVTAIAVVALGILRLLAHGERRSMPVSADEASRTPVQSPR